MVSEASEALSAFPRLRAASPPVAERGRPKIFTRVLAGLDAAVVGLAVGTGLVLRFGFTAASVSGLPAGTLTGSYVVVATAVVLAWLVSLSVHNTRDWRILGTGPEEYKRVIAASFRLFAIVALVSFVGRLSLSRVFVAVAFPVGVGLLMLERWLARKWLQRRRLAGEYGHRVLVVGGCETAEHLISELQHARHAGYQVVGACLPGGAPVVAAVAGVPVLGGMSRVLAAAGEIGADTVAVVPSPGLGAKDLRRLAWRLEGTGIELVVAPALTDVAGPRVQVRPVAGLPLLHVAAPQYEGPTRVVKELSDRVGATLLLLLSSPVLVLAAILIKLDSSGPVLFRQRRVGRNGQTFVLYKFRSMVDDAERQRGKVAGLNEQDGVMFKIRQDPRVTRMGRWLRRLSVDELPQLFNVLRGQMSLVGPRPPLPEEVARYHDDVRRRLLVKPGITGLWQVSGRADLSWEDSVRLDLYYVENWSLVADLLILWKTASAVLRGRGAY